MFFLCFICFVCVVLLILNGNFEFFVNNDNNVGEYFCGWFNINLDLLNWCVVSDIVWVFVDFFLLLIF